MIDFFFGKPRTGKSYRAVKYLYDGYIRDLDKDKTPHFKNIVTNIGGFNFELVNKKFLDHGSSSRAYKLVWAEFYKRLKVLYDMAMSEKSDLELNKYADYHHINDCMILIDEASLFLKKYDDVLSWYFAYHGHFRVRLIIIAQSPKQIYAEYMEHTEIFYEAQPQAKQITNSSLRYIHYSDIPFNKDNKFSSSTIKTDPKIYELYKSGEIDKPKKIIYKFIIYVFLALLFVLFVGKLFMDRTTKKLHPEISPGQTSPVQTSPVQTSPGQISSNINSSNSIFIRVRCDQTSCARIDPSIRLLYIPKLYFQESVKSFDHSLIASSTVEILGVSYVDSFYSVDKNYLTSLGVWSVPSLSSGNPSQPPVNSVVGGSQ